MRKLRVVKQSGTTEEVEWFELQSMANCVQGDLEVVRDRWWILSLLEGASNGFMDLLLVA